MADLKITIQAQDKGATATVHNVERAFNDSLREIGGMVGGLGDVFTEVGEDIAASMKSAVDEIKDQFSDLEEESEDTGKGIADNLASGLKWGAGGIFSVAKGVFGGILSVGTSVLSGLTSVVTGAFSFAFNAAVKVVGGILSGIGSVISTAFSGIGAILDTVILAPFRLVFNKITGIAAAAGLGAGVKFAADFQDSLSTAFALIPHDMTPAMRQAMQRTMENIRGDTGASGRALGRALFTAISTGFGEASPTIVGAAAKLAAVGESADDVAETTQVLTGALNAFGFSAAQAEQIADKLQKTQQLGNVTNREVALNLGRVLGAAKSAGVGFDEMLASIALATQKGMTAEQTFTGLLGAIISLSSSAPEAQKMMSELGIVLHDNEGNFIGLEKAIKRVSEAGLKVQDLRKVIPEKMARGFFLAISDSLDKYREFIAEVGDSGGALNAAMEERNRSVSRQFDRLMGNIANSFSTVFIAFEEDFAAIGGYTADVVGNIVVKLREMKDEGKIDALVDQTKEWGKALLDILPTWEQVKKFGVDAADFIAKAWRVLASEIGGESSLLSLGLEIAFDYSKELALDATDAIKKSFLNIIDSEVATGILNKVDALFSIITAKAKSYTAGMGDLFKATSLQFAYDIGDFFGLHGEGAGGVSDVFGFDLSKWLREEIIEARGASTKATGIDPNRFARDMEILLAPLNILPTRTEGDERSREEKIDQFLAELKRVTADAAPAGERTAEIMQSFADAVSQIFDTTEAEVAAPIQDSKEQTKAAVEKQKVVLVEMKEAMVDMSRAQGDYVRENGKYNQVIVREMREMKAEYQRAQEEFRRLMESLQ